MSEAIIVRGGIAAGGETVDLSGINASLSSINSKINTVNSKLNTMNNRINNAVSGAGDAPTNAFIISNQYYVCSRSGNYWVEVVGGGGGAGDGTHQTYGAGSGYVSNRLIRLNKNEAVYVTIGDSAGWYQTSSGGTSSFGTYLSAAGGISGEDGIAGNGGNSGNRWNSGILYYNSSNNMRISTTGGTIRLYRGDGGNIRAVQGIGGCVIVRYVN